MFNKKISFKDFNWIIRSKNQSEYDFLIWKTHKILTDFVIRNLTQILLIFWFRFLILKVKQILLFVKREVGKKKEDFQ